MNFTSIFRDQYTNLPIALTEEDVRNGTYIVTGANTGLGYECVKRLARLRAKRVILAVRNTKAGLDAVATIEKEVEDVITRFEVWELDLARFASVKAFARRVESSLDRVDALIQNAAIAASAWNDGENGWDLGMTVNVISTMLLAVLVLPHLRATGRKAGIVPRIAIIGSAVAFTPEGKRGYEELDKSNIFRDITNRQKWEPLMSDMYPFSKLLLFFCYRSLAAAAAPKDGSGVIITFVNPGICYTSLNRSAPAFSPVNIQVVVARVLMGRSAEMGSRTLIHGAIAGEDCHGTYVSECQAKEHYIPDWVNDERGRETEAQSWKEIQDILESLVPGCVDRAVRFSR